MSAHDATPRVPATVGWSKHRVEALTDGIFAVAMKLLVIDLKLPDHATIHTHAELLQALANLLPKAVSWLISFFVLAIFWISHHRMLHYVRSVDQGLLWRNIIQLALVSLMPFSSSIVGEYANEFASQVLYNGNMMGLALVGLWKARYIRRHPELCNTPMPDGTYHAARLRIGGLVVIGIVALALAWGTSASFATFAYMLMIAIGRYSRRLEAQHPDAGPQPTLPDAPSRPVHSP
ncbi:MAG: TMEM175 family protein [Burkholderiaceae bacterium]